VSVPTVSPAAKVVFPSEKEELSCSAVAAVSVAVCSETEIVRASGSAETWPPASESRGPWACFPAFGGEGSRSIAAASVGEARFQPYFPPERLGVTELQQFDRPFGFEQAASGGRSEIGFRADRGAQGGSGPQFRRGDQGDRDEQFVQVCDKVRVQRQRDPVFRQQVEGPHRSGEHNVGYHVRVLAERGVDMAVAGRQRRCPDQSPWWSASRKGTTFVARLLRPSAPPARRT
jgi:hypothetical protein